MERVRRRKNGGIPGARAVDGRATTARMFEPRKPIEVSDKDLQYIQGLSRVLAALGPPITAVKAALQDVWKALQPYHPDELVLVVVGLCLTFFGGVFMTIVASVEAAILFGWERIRSALMRLRMEWQHALEAFERDNMEDTDGDGVPDVLRMDPQALAARRVLVLVKSVDPESLAMAVEGLTTASLAILATLRVRFAAAITLGTSIGDVVFKTFGPWIVPLMEKALPDDYERWCPVVARYTARYIGITASWMLMRVTASVFSAMRGSSLVTTALSAYAVRHGYVSKQSLGSGEPVLAGAWAVLAAAGFFWQVRSGFRLGFPLNMLLLPVTILEKVLVGVVGTSTV